MKKHLPTLTTILLLLLPVAAYAATPSAPELVAATIKQATDKVLFDLQTYAIRILAILTLLQFTISNIKLIGQAADIDRVFAKLTGSIFWFTFCYIVLFNGSSFLYTASEEFLQKAAGWTVTGYFNASDVMNSGFTMYLELQHAVSEFSSKNDTGVLGLLEIYPALITFTTGLVIIVTCGIIAIKLFMIKIEMGVVIAMSPLSFSLLGLDSLRDQGIAPFKYLIAIIYRIVLLAMIVTAMKTVGDSMTQILNTKQTCEGDDCDVWTPIFSGLFGYVLLAFIAIKSDVIAANLSSGSTNLSSGDMASSVATGVAAGMAVASGGAAALALASAGKQSGADFLKEASRGMEMSGSGSGNVGGGGGGANHDNIAPPPVSEPRSGGHEASATFQGNTVGNQAANPKPSLKSQMFEAAQNIGKHSKALSDQTLHHSATTSAHINTHGDS